MSATTTVHSHPSSKLGPVPYGPGDVIRFPDGLPGFEALREFLLVSREECAPFVFLAALDNPDVALPLLPLSVAAPGQAERIAAEATRALPGQAGALIGCYAVVVITEAARDISANLRAPVVVDLDQRRGAQVILGDDSLPVACPIGG